jgi:hypothetical protein
LLSGVAEFQFLSDQQDRRRRRASWRLTIEALVSTQAGQNLFRGGTAQVSLTKTANPVFASGRQNETRVLRPFPEYL